MTDPRHVARISRSMDKLVARLRPAATGHEGTALAVLELAWRRLVAAPAETETLPAWVEAELAGWSWDGRAPGWNVDPTVTPTLFGHLLERMVNRRELGAYYTPPDITRYVASATIVPLLLRRMAGSSQGAALLGPAGSAWPVLADESLAFLAESSAWLATDQPAQLEFRSQQRARLRHRVAAGGPVPIDDLVDANVDLLPWLVQAIARCADPAAVRWAWTVACDVRVADPTCGSGAFLSAAADVLEQVLHACCVALEVMGEQPPVPPGPSRRVQLRRRVVAHNLHGSDVLPEAIRAAQLRMSLEFAARGMRVPPADCCPRLVVADLLTDPDPFAHPIDCFIGNPPYVEVADAPPALATASCGNTFAWCTERAADLVAEDGALGLVLPVSVLSADRFAAVRAVLARRCVRLWASSFDTIPSTLFDGVVQRVAVLVGEADIQSGGCVTATTGYRRWGARERTNLVPSLAWCRLPVRHAEEASAPIPKLANPVEQGILARLSAHPPLGELLVGSSASPRALNGLWYKRRWSYFLFFANFVPEIRDAAGSRRLPSELKRLEVDPSLDARAVLAALASSAFYLYFTAMSDNRNLNLRDIRAFPFGRPGPDMEARLVEAADELMAALREHSTMRTCTYGSVGTISNQYFFQGMTKPVVDAIDELLGEHYGLDAEAVTYLQRFDAPFRAGPAGATSLPEAATALSASVR